MSRSSVLILLGILVMLVPFSGLPSSFRTFLALALGAGILAIGLSMRMERVRASKAQHTPEPLPEPISEPQAMSTI